MGLKIYNLDTDHAGVVVMLNTLFERCLDYWQTWHIFHGFSI